ncbi:MAG TPA: hypothetical protein PLK76_02555 [bacterium]|nr:hypothetical protein [bacterium]
MQINQQKILEFRGLWKKHFGEEISDEFAYEQAENLCSLLKKIYKPIRKFDFEKIQASDAENN